MKKKSIKLLGSLQSHLSYWFSILFVNWRLNKKTIIFAIVWIFFLYVSGIFLWGVFFDWNQTPLNFLDWKGNMPRYDAVRDAFQYRMLPLHINCEKCLHSLTDRFFVLPDVITTPQMIFLPFMELTSFFYLDLLLHYTVGVLGLIYLQNKFKLSLIAYSALFFLFNFNGYIEAHLGAGHVTWNSYFLFPWFFILVFQLLEKQVNWLWVTKLAFLSLYVVLSGGQHHFTWMMLFLVMLALSQKKLFKWIFSGVLFSGFLSAIRLLPPLIMVTTYTSGDHFKFLSGYSTISGFLSALVNIRPSTYGAEGLPYPIGYWELDYFVGILGAILIIYFGLVRWLQDQNMQKKFSALLIPSAILFLFAQGNFYKYTFFSLPPFSSERVPTRMVSIPITLLIIVGTVYFQKFLQSRDSKIVRLVAGFSLLYIVNELVTHTVVWKVDRIAPFWEKPIIDYSGNSIILRSDPSYIWVLWIGLAITLLTAFTLGFLVMQEQRKDIRLDETSSKTKAVL